MKAITKNIIFRLALSGLLPVKAAEWLIRYGGLTNE